jgi:enoyl-CoA hydratase
MIEIERRGEVAIVRMQRGKGNALNIELAEAFDRTLDALDAPDIRAAVITGQGSVFGAGVDLQELVAGGAAYVQRFLPLLNRVFERLARFPKPLIAAVNGHAIAGGAILMLACDQRIAAKGRARFGLTEILVGVSFPAWALEIARFATPPEHFQTLILTGRTWKPEEALARGLLDELVEPEQLESRAIEVAQELGALSSATFATTKLAVRRPLFEAVAASAAAEAKLVESWSGPEVLARVTEFVERTISRKTP